MFSCISIRKGKVIVIKKKQKGPNQDKGKEEQYVQHSSFTHEDSAQRAGRNVKLSLLKLIIHDTEVKNGEYSRAALC